VANLIDNNVKEQIKDIVLTLIFSLLYIFLVARISVLLLALLPIPYILLGYRNNIRTSILAMVILFTIINLMTNLYVATTIVMTFLPIILVIHYMIKKNYSNSKIIIVATLVFVVSIFATIKFEESVNGFKLIDQMDRNFESTLNFQIETFKEMKMSNSEINNARQLIRGTYNYIVTVMPMIMMGMCLVVAYLNYKISAYLINKTEDGNLIVPDFSLFSLPSNFIMGTIVMFLSYYVISKLGLAYAEALRQNLSFLIGFLFLLQGFSLVDYFLKKIRVKKFFRVLIIILNSIFLPIGSMLIILGFVDSVFDLRKLRKKD